MPEKSIESDPSTAPDAETVRKAGDKSQRQSDLSLEYARQTIRKAYAAIERGYEVLARR